MRNWFLTIIGVLALTASGCGYTTKSLLPSEMKFIYVENFVNKIPISGQTSEERMYRGYRPNLEFDITKAVIDRFIFDGNLRISNKESADLILSSELADFKKEAVRYDSNDNVEEYRIRLVVNMVLQDVRNKTLMWREKEFAGEATYMVTGPLAKSEASALDDARADLARRIVERTIEGW